MKNNTFARHGLTAVAIATSLTLAACGGGSGAGSGTASSASSAGPSSASGNTATPATSVPAATYAAGSAQLAMFAAVNSLRGALGVGLLAQDPVLDVVLVQIAGSVEPSPTDKYTLSIEQDGIPDGGRSGFVEPETG